jgi:ABC-type polysaccharide transport system permease subunit
MKNWNLFKLKLEMTLRLSALIIGFAECVFLSIAVFQNSLVENRLDKTLTSIHQDPIFMSVIFINFFIIPLLISIFILVATRKFKEINQLIEKNKKL